MRSLEAVGANVLGTVMNNVKAGRGGYYGYGGYTYGCKRAVVRRRAHTAL